MASSQLQIPYSKLNGRLITPEKASRGDDYRCPNCESSVYLRAGPHRQPHFAHHPKSTCEAGGGESLVHLQAKLRLKLAFEAANKDDGNPIKFYRECASCGKGHWQSLKLRGKLGEVLTEHTVVNKVNGVDRRADIAIFNPDQSIHLLIEVAFSHQVDEAKRADLGEVPWIEVLASQVRDNPTVLMPQDSGNLRPFERCPTKHPTPTITSHRRRRHTSVPPVNPERLGRIPPPGLPGKNEIKDKPPTSEELYRYPDNYMRSNRNVFRYCAKYEHIVRSDGICGRCGRRGLTVHRHEPRRIGPDQAHLQRRF